MQAIGGIRRAMMLAALSGSTLLFGTSQARAGHDNPYALAGLLVQQAGQFQCSVAEMSKHVPVCPDLLRHAGVLQSQALLLNGQLQAGSAQCQLEEVVRSLEQTQACAEDEIEDLRVPRRSCAYPVYKQASCLIEDIEDTIDDLEDAICHLDRYRGKGCAIQPVRGRPYGNLPGLFRGHVPGYNVNPGPARRGATPPRVFHEEPVIPQGPSIQPVPSAPVPRPPQLAPAPTRPEGSSYHRARRPGRSVLTPVGNRSTNFEGRLGPLRFRF
ncbi:hypothetical protein Pan216_13680 [Planctomycetes bacterium Pan216]|uniref:Uncharacterized protein n=1 Tax=Kolteria novifilia TaxID=2527975 RepID=A0A518B0M2_9BACT|nr:hypothetical protein Pan216_13680 [Planctomycetes bacterium Pan216]